MNRYIGAVITGVLILGTATAVSAQDWPQWRGINRDGKVEGFKAPETWPDTTKLDRFGSVIDAGSVLMGLSPKSELIVLNRKAGHIPNWPGRKLQRLPPRHILL